MAMWPACPWPSLWREEEDDALVRQVRRLQVVRRFFLKKAEDNEAQGKPSKPLYEKAFQIECMRQHLMNAQDNKDYINVCRSATALQRRLATETERYLDTECFQNLNEAFEEAAEVSRLCDAPLVDFADTADGDISLFSNSSSTFAVSVCPNEKIIADARPIKDSLAHGCELPSCPDFDLLTECREHRSKGTGRSTRVCAQIGQ